MQMMKQFPRLLLCVFVATALVSSCSSPIPDHARYIPKDAVATAGVNLKGLSKKIAWSMITGSKLFKEMQDRIPEKNTKDAMNGIEKAGIDFINTLYVYVKTDNRFTGGNRITGLVPLSDAGQWETYLKQVFPQAAITQHGDHKEASLGRDMYVGWNKKVLIVMNTIDGDRSDKPSSGGVADMSAEMDNAFNVSSANSIKGNKHFTDLELEGHDVSFMLNYDQMMTQMSGNMAEKIGVSLQNTMWKDAALTTGFDFVKGKITGDMHYYMPNMKDIGAELGSTNIDKGLLDRLPGQDMDMFLGMHLSPKAIKAILEKMSMLGTANVGLSTIGLSVDNVLDAFTGDMAIVMNDFSLVTEKETDNFMGQTVVHETQKPRLSLTYVMKINKPAEFQKLVKLAKDQHLPEMGDGFVIPIDAHDSVYILMNNEYAVAGNNYAKADGILKGTLKDSKMNEAASGTVYGHPTSFFLDVQQMLRNIDPAVSHNAHDSVMINESKKLIKNISFSGGAFTNDAFAYHLDINFMNTEENSIINLMDYGMKMNDADKLKSNNN